MPAGVQCPRPRSSSQRTTPSAAASPNALPPVSKTAWTCVALTSGDNRSVSRVPGPPPRTSPEATAPPSGASTTVHPVAASASVQWPTQKPSGSPPEPGTWSAGRVERRRRPFGQLPQPLAEQLVDPRMDAHARVAGVDLDVVGVRVDAGA